MAQRLTSFLILLTFVLQAPHSFAKQPVNIAIVIDDIGNSAHDLLALSLPPAITLSILPYTPHAKKIARLAIAQERELLLHVPMQAKQHNDKLGQGALMLDMQERAFKAQLRKALDYLPDITGINNHMGSTLTEHVKQMQWTMDVLNKQGVYFLDSRTTANTIAESTARISGTPALRRHVFLDNIKTDVAMEKQFSQAVTLGQQGNAVVIIAHPYPETIRFLSNKFKQKNKQIQLVSLQTLLPERDRLAMAKKRNEFRQANNVVINDADHPKDKQLQ